MNAKKKTLIITTTSAMALGAMGMVFALSNSETLFKGVASNEISDSIVFSRETGEFYDISGDGKKTSVSGTTSRGSTYYLISKNDTSISGTNYVSDINDGTFSSAIEYIYFSNDKEGESLACFQGVTGIKIKTSTSSTMYVLYSNNGINYSDSNYYAVAVSSSPSKVEFASPVTYFRIVSNNGFHKYVASVELFYDCSLSA